MRHTKTIALVFLFVASGCSSEGGGKDAGYSWGAADTVEHLDSAPGPDTRAPEDTLPQDTEAPDIGPTDIAPTDTPTPDVPEPDICTPDCAGKECGLDGCGGTCGTCPDGEGCGPAGLCQCTPDCNGKICGDDGCGGTCGACAPGSTCQGGACVPDACEGCAPWQTCVGGPCQDPAALGECPFGGMAISADCHGTAWEGCCNGDALYYCENAGNSGCPVGMNTCLCALDCGADATTCGWGEQFFMCVEPPAQPGPGGLNCDWAGECFPSCAGKQCGSDGCGGSCGACPLGQECQAGICASSTSSCAGLCGGSAPSGCFCDEGCVGFGDCCADVCQACPALSFCECVPDCSGKDCGDNGCGGSCGTCPEGVPCEDGVCACVPACSGKECGDDGCGGSCGTCPMVAPDCVDGFCQLPCDPACDGKDCGDNGCGGSCGECEPGFICEESVCVVCEAQCEGLECGDDGCGGSCGECADPFATCEAGLCVACEPLCLGKQCGPDGCGGECGQCAEGTHCTAGVCMADCTPDCGFQECGDDGCGGICGLCPCETCWEKEFECSSWGNCQQPFTYTCKQIDQCVGTCDAGDDWCIQTCQSSGSQEAQDQLEALITCLDDNGYYDCSEGDDPCQTAVIEDICWAEYKGCFNGDLTCSQLHDCVFDWCDGDPDCGGLCFQDATNVAQNIFQAWDECIIAECGEDPEDACKALAENGPCAALLIACLYDD